MKKLISLLLVLALVAAWLPAQALAVTIAPAVRTPMPQILEKNKVVYFNPLYPTPDEAVLAQWLDSDFLPAAEETPVYAETLQAAAAALRQKLVERQNKITVYYKVHTDAYDSEKLAASIFEEAVIHTGNPKEGDALRWVYQGWVSETQGTSDGEYDSLAITYNVVYYTTAQQEAELDAAVEDLLDSFQFKDSTSDYAKVKTIYDYICANVTYDFEHLNNETYTLQFTAYAALIQGTAVCQGYALLMYRLLLEEGIDCRLIGSIPQECHAWNIVKLGDYYYNCDSTWDAALYPDYEWFLLADWKFKEHTRDTEYATEEFYAQYPMDPVNYDPETSHTHDYKEVVVTPPTCTKEGYTTHTCSVCGLCYRDNYTAATGHALDEGTVYPPTCKYYGYTLYTCTVCGELVFEDYVDKLPHTYDAGVITLPTCTEQGYTTFTCTVCGDSYRDHYVPKGHNYVEEIVTATCTNDGYTANVCTLCGESIIVAYDIPQGHILGEDLLCTICGRPEYVFEGELNVGDLILGEDGVYYTAYADVVFVAVTLQRSPHTFQDTLYHKVEARGESRYSLTYWDQILASVNEDGCMVLTAETLTWMLDLMKVNNVSSSDVWELNGYLCCVLDHVHEYETVTTPPTCTESGSIEEICIHCGLVGKSEWLPMGCTYDEGVVTPPTCNSNGYTTYTCTVCGRSYESDYTPYADHTFAEEGVVTPPTCTSEGYTTYTCTHCGETSIGNFVDRLSHTPDASCVCSICGNKVYVVDCGLEVDALVLGDDGVYYTAHGDMVMIAISAPLESWLSGNSLADYVEEFGSYYFSMTYWEELLAETNADGYAPLTQDTLAWMLDLITANPFWGEDETYLTYYLGFPQDHIHEFETEEVAPTCTEMGLKEQICTQCSYYNREYLDPLGHNLDENCVCTVCGVKLEYVVDCGLTLADLTMGTDGMYYTAEGYVAVIAVTAPLEIWLGGNSLADYVYVFGESLFSLTYWEFLLAEANADGYAPLTSATLSWILDVITANPAGGQTVEELTHYIGYYTKPSFCEHNYTAVVTEPTCASVGYTIHTCTLCGDSYRDSYTDPLEHSYTTTVTEPTCTKGGCTTYTCTACGYFYEDYDVAPLGHSFADVVTAPTCTEGGYTTHTCTLCGSFYVDGHTDPAGHSYTDGVCVHCGAQEEVKVLLGDVNGDGQINTRDAKLIMQYELGLIDESKVNLTAADVNGDGQINTRDAKLIMQLELGLITEFPAP